MPRRERRGNGGELATSNAGSIFREQRAAQNEALFRSINEHIEPLDGASDRTNDHKEFVCECPDSSCVAPISMSVDEYEALRRHPNHFAVLPDDAHVWPDVERVVERNNRYWIVEKTGHAAAVTAKLDPRSAN
jgi:hypothetical protein